MKAIKITLWQKVLKLLFFRNECKAFKYTHNEALYRHFLYFISMDSLKMVGRKRRKGTWHSRSEKAPQRAGDFSQELHGAITRACKVCRWRAKCFLLKSSYVRAEWKWYSRLCVPKTIYHTQPAIYLSKTNSTFLFADNKIDPIPRLPHRFRNHTNWLNSTYHRICKITRHVSTFLFPPIINTALLRAKVSNYVAFHTNGTGFRSFQTLTTCFPRIPKPGSPFQLT